MIGESVNTPAAPIGHNSRRADIERTARSLSKPDELRAALLARENGTASAKQKILNHALVCPDVKDSEYRVMSLEMKFAGPNGCFLDPQNGAAILGRSLSAYERAIKGLETKKWCDRQRRFNSTSVRTYEVPGEILRASEELATLLDLESESANLPFQSTESANSPFHSNESANLPIQSGSESANSPERIRKFADLIPSSLIPLERERDLDPHRVHQIDAGGDLLAALPPRDREGLVEVSGTAIRAPGITIPLSLIDSSARSFKMELELAREIAKGIVEGWIANGIRPKNPPAQITAALKQYRPTASRAPKLPKSEYTDDFNHFWELYPRKEGKGEAFKSWDRLPIEQRRRVYAALKRQLPYLKDRARQEGNLCPHAATWLNQKRFDDEPKATRTTI
jgi:hypothetical protein